MHTVQEAVRGLWDKEWLPMISGKQALYNGIAQYHQSRVCNTSKVNSITVQCTMYRAILQIWRICIKLISPKL